MLGIFLVFLACACWALDTLIRYPLLNSGTSAFSIVFYEHLFLVVIFSFVLLRPLFTRRVLNSLLGGGFKRVLIGLIYFFGAGWLNLKKNLVPFLVVGGIGSACATLAFTHAFNYLNPSVVILLQKFQPVVAICMARVLLKEKVEKDFILWAIVCIFGGFLISIEHFQALSNTIDQSGSLHFSPDYLWGYLFVTFAVIGWGTSTVFGKKLSLNNVRSEHIMAGRFMLGFLALIPFVPFQESLFSLSEDIYGKIFLMAFISGVLAMYFYYHGLGKLSARVCSLCEMFFPFTAVIVNWIFLDAKLSIIQLIGGGILLLGSFIIQLKRY